MYSKLEVKNTWATKIINLLCVSHLRLGALHACPWKFISPVFLIYGLHPNHSLEGHIYF